MQARIAYNAAKKDTSAGQHVQRNSTMEKELQKIARRDSADGLSKKLQSEAETTEALTYLESRMAEVNRKIANLSGAEELAKHPRLYYERKAIVKAELAVRERRKEVTKHTSEKLTGEQIHRRTTTTYDAARKRRIKNFDAYFFGSGK